MNDNKTHHVQLLFRKKILILFAIFLFCSETSAQFKITKTEPDPFFEAERNKFNVQPILRYNRVSGPVVGMDYSLVLKKMWNIEFNGQASYGLEDKFRYQAGIQKSFFQLIPLTIGAAYYNQISTQDEWTISYNENSAAAFFIKEDFMDYYAQQGFVAFIDQKFNEVHTIRLEVDQQAFISLAKHTNWALLGEKKNFRNNPAIVEEKATSLRFIWALDWRDNPLLPISGWYLDGKLEQTIGEITDTRGFFMSIKRYQPAFSIHAMQMKILIGSRSGCPASYSQYLMDLGGIGTLLGYRDKEFKNGNRFLFGTVRYLFNGDIMNRLPFHFLPFHEQLTLGVFAETGWLFFADQEKNVLAGFGSLAANQMKSDVGVSLYITDGVVRIDFAKRTDRAKNSCRITLRLMEQF